ncbi:Protein N-terminal asparagine amidohydrolase, partial [Araneus ventricosus]
SNNSLRGNINWPVIYGIGLNIKSGEIFPATFPDKGPDFPLRCARYFTGCYEMLDIYDCHLGMLRIGPYNYEPLRGVDLWLSQSDDFILQPELYLLYIGSAGVFWLADPAVVMMQEKWGYALPNNSYFRVATRPGNLENRE